MQQISTRDHTPVCINYLDFLAACCKKRWRFLDAIYGVLPFFGMVTRKNTLLTPISPGALKALALQILSPQVSDEVNIVRLITLAQQQHIVCIEIQLPYPLSDAQLAAVRQEYGQPLWLQQREERLSITIPS